jgi:hypothetical protein
MGTSYVRPRLRMQRDVYFLPTPGKQRAFRWRQPRPAQIFVALGKLSFQVWEINQVILGCGSTITLFDGSAVMEIDVAPDALSAIASAALPS